MKKTIVVSIFFVLCCFIVAPVQAEDIDLKDADYIFSRKVYDIEARGDSLFIRIGKKKTLEYSLPASLMVVDVGNEYITVYIEEDGAECQNMLIVTNNQFKKLNEHMSFYKSIKTPESCWL